MPVTARQPRLVVAGPAGLLGHATAQLPVVRVGNVVNVSAADAVRTALTRKPTALLLPEETGMESGYLIAAKVAEARKKLKVVLVGATHTPVAERFANFVGANFVVETDCVHTLLNALRC